MANEFRTPLQSDSPILIVDDDASQRSLLNSFLSSQGFNTVTASSGEEALHTLSARDIGMMISDVRMPGMSGLETLKRSREKHPRLPVLMITAYTDIRDAVGAMRDGAVNYLAKPIDLDELFRSVKKALGVGEEKDLQCIGDSPMPAEVIAVSPLMRNVLRDAALVAPSESRVLITGESGVGKEVVADLIHAWSHRSRQEFIKVNCAAIPDTLLEAELFGHEKGAFTGANQRRVGRFEEAGEGTVLLDEIGEMSSALQAKLLRVLEDGTYQRIGSNSEHKSGARILASTNQDLEKQVREGSFREDLFFRLNVMEINVPPLREHREDILPLANSFAEEFTRGNSRFSSAVSACLEAYDWPGNVRELRNAMERACLMSQGELILPQHLPGRIQNTPLENTPDDSQKATRMEEVERATILQTLRENGFNRTETAKVLGISRRSLTYKLQRYKSDGYSIDRE